VINSNHMTITKPIIIVGTGRCGSAVFHRLLATHPGVPRWSKRQRQRRDSSYRTQAVPAAGGRELRHTGLTPWRHLRLRPLQAACLFGRARDISRVKPAHITDSHLDIRRYHRQTFAGINQRKAGVVHGGTTVRVLVATWRSAITRVAPGRGACFSGGPST
jgi:hypothetical protein